MRGSNGTDFKGTACGKSLGAPMHCSLAPGRGDSGTLSFSSCRRNRRAGMIQ